MGDCSRPNEDDDDDDGSRALRIVGREVLRGVRMDMGRASDRDADDARAAKEDGSAVGLRRCSRGRMVELELAWLVGRWTARKVDGGRRGMAGGGKSLKTGLSCLFGRAERFGSSLLVSPS